MRVLSCRICARHPISHAPDGRDDVRSKLPSQVADINVHDIGVGVEVVAPGMAEELLAGEHLTLVGEERLEERELLGGQPHLLPVPLDTSSGDVDDDIPVLIAGRSHLAGVTEPGTDPGQQFVESEGLGNEVAGAEVQSRDQGVDVVTSGQNDYGDVATRRTELGQDRQSVHTGQAESEYEEVESSRPCLPKRRIPVLDHGGGVPSRLQAFRNEGGNSRLVLGHQDAAHVTAPEGTGVSGSRMTKSAPPRELVATDTWPR